MLLQHRSRSEEGSALYATVVVGIAVVGLSVAMANMSLATKEEFQAANLHLQRYYAAEAGVTHSLLDLAQGGDGVVGSPTAPMNVGGVEYWVAAVPNGPRRTSLQAYGRTGGQTRSVDAMIEELVPGVFHHAMFAGNSSNDANYTLDLGGTGSQADLINGDVFSANDVDIVGDAAVSGTIRAGGTITGGTGEEGATQPLPDIAGANYAVNHDVNVAAEFTAHESFVIGGSYGGDAFEVPAGNPAHIFRKNPSDRATNWSVTAKDDYFLEDVGETLDGSNDSSDGSGTPISVQPSAAEAVYYIDGNLWIHNYNIYTFRMTTVDAGHDVRITFAVKGNIYFSDNVILDDATNDAIAFIAVKDDLVPDSGNIYFGDTQFGTLERMDAYMYAENDFLDNNLDESGSSEVVVNGIMSAGNHVNINRDYEDQHSRLVVNFDDRIQNGDIDLPGLPSVAGGGGGASRFRVVWSMEAHSDDGVYEDSLPTLPGGDDDGDLLDD